MHVSSGNYIVHRSIIIGIIITEQHILIYIRPFFIDLTSRIV